ITCELAGRRSRRGTAYSVNCWFAGKPYLRGTAGQTTWRRWTTLTCWCLEKSCRKLTCGTPQHRLRRTFRNRSEYPSLCLRSAAPDRSTQPLGPETSPCCFLENRPPVSFRERTANSRFTREATEDRRPRSVTS